MKEHPLMSLKEVRTLLRVPASDIAERLGITLQSFYRHERGERRIYFDKVLVIGRMLDVDPRWFGRPLTADEMHQLFDRRVEAERAELDKQRAAQEPAAPLTDQEDWELTLQRIAEEDARRRGEQTQVIVPPAQPDGDGLAVPADERGDPDQQLAAAAHAPLTQKEIEAEQRVAAIVGDGDPNDPTTWDWGGAEGDD